MRFKKLFGDKKAIIGMIHLSGVTRAQKIKRALLEIEIYQQCGLSGCIVENYHGTTADVVEALEEIDMNVDNSFKVGINILPNDFELALDLADEYGDFIQIDHIAGEYEHGKPIGPSDMKAKERFPNVVILGGVWPKYYTPIQTSSLKTDVLVGMGRSDALVVSGQGTGKETPLPKIKTFRKFIGERYPLIVGAGVDQWNIAEQMEYADGAIVGSCFKLGKMTHTPVHKQRVVELMERL